jgi:hypothetical protein
MLAVELSANPVHIQFRCTIATAAWPLAAKKVVHHTIS